MEKQLSIETEPVKQVKRPIKWKEIEALKDKLALDKLLNEYEYGKDYFNNVV